MNECHWRTRLALVCACALLLACSQHGDWNTKPDSGSKTLAITMPLGAATTQGFRVTRVHVAIEREGYSDAMDLAIAGDTASGVFINLEPATYTIAVEVYDGETLIAEGTGEGEVLAGETTTVHIDLAFYVGNLEIIVNWPGLVGVPIDGLVACYTFEGSADDVSGNEHHGVVEQVTLTADGFEGQAYEFTGFGHIALPIDINPAAMPEVTIGAWVNPDVSDGQRAIISHDDSWFDRHLAVDWRNGGPGYAAFCGPGDEVLNSGTVDLGRWTFVAASYDGTTVTLWVDDQSFTGLDGTETGQTFLWIGANPVCHCEHFDGRIDNVFVFDRVLDGDELAAVRAGGAAALVGSAGD